MKCICKIFVITALLASTMTVKAETDYCHDAAINAEWKRMIIKYPDDDIVLHLAGLREGLCNMVDRGEITKNKAIDIFESAKGGAVQSRFTEQVLNSKNTDKEI